MTHFRKISVLRLHYNNPFAPVQSLRTVLDTNRYIFIKTLLCSALNRSPESRGPQTSGVLLVLFVQAKRVKPFPFGNFRGFANLESAHTGGGFAQAASRRFPTFKKVGQNAGRRDAAPYRESTLRVQQACFASIFKGGKAAKKEAPAFRRCFFM